MASVGEVLIDSDVVVSMPIVDRGEPFAEVGVAVREHGAVRNRGPSRFMARQGVVDRLGVAATALAGARLVVVEAHRALSVQRRFWEHRFEQVRQAHPGWSDVACGAETARFVAPPSGHPPHSTGGAVDVILVDLDGVELDLGSGLNQPSPLMATAAVVPPAARGWRQQLVEAMEGAGFVNYPEEWWHYSYGDQYWAWRTGASAALYGSADPARLEPITSRR